VPRSKDCFAFISYYMSGTVRVKNKDVAVTSRDLSGTGQDVKLVGLVDGKCSVGTAKGK
jgi:hypothetical protein